MYELKLARAAAVLYRSVLNLSIKLVNIRDKRNVKKYHARVNHAEMQERMAQALWDDAATERDLANADLNVQSRAATEALNLLENAADDISLRV